jgi:hypothetical protein
MSTPAFVVQGIAHLEEERRSIASRLDAIDLALLNLRLIYPTNAAPTAVRVPRAGKAKAAKRTKVRTLGRAVHDVATRDRDEAILKALRRNGGVGTAKEIRKGMPSAGMTDEQAAKAFGNAMHRLKSQGLVNRTGHTWSLVGAGSEAA